MRLSIAHFAALCAGLLILSCAKAESFQTINAVELTSPDGIETLSYAVQDEDFLYYTMLSPVVVGKVNKTLLATPGWKSASPSIQVSTETVSFGLLDKESESLFWQGQRVSLQVSTTNLTLLNSRVGPEVNSGTGFISKDTEGASFANFFSFGQDGQEFVVQFRLDDPTMNTSEFRFPFQSYVIGSSYDPLNDVAVLVSEDSVFVYEWNTKDLLLTFKINGLSIREIVHDAVTNTLYTCGDQPNSYAPVLTRVNLSLVQNNTELSFSLNSRYYSNEVITVQTIGDDDMSCRALALHSSGQLVYALYDPPSSAGIIGRAVALTLDTIETTTVDTALSQKPILLLVDDNKPLIYVFTETEVEAVMFSTTFECPLDCSGHGHCDATTNYFCVCDKPYSGHNCESNSTVAEPPVYEPMRVIGQINVPNAYTYGSIADDEFIYLFTNYSLSIAKVAKTDVLSSTQRSLDFINTTINQFSVAIQLIDMQLGLFYFISTSDYQVKFARVSTSNFNDVLITNIDPNKVTTAFISNDSRNSTYVNMFGQNTALRYVSSQTNNPLQSLPTISAYSSPHRASLFLPQSNTAVIVTEYRTIHYDFNTGNITNQYILPSDFIARTMAADEERGKLYILGHKEGGWYLVVLTPGSIPRDTTFSMSGSNSNFSAIDLSSYYSDAFPMSSLLLDHEYGQAIIATYSGLIRLNLQTLKVFDKMTIFAQQAYYDSTNRTLFVVSATNIAAFYIPPPCPRNCRGNGQCVYGVCQCNDGFAGDQCEPISPVAPIADPSGEPGSEEPAASLPISNVTSTASSMIPLLSFVAVAFVVVKNFIL